MNVVEEEVTGATDWVTGEDLPPAPSVRAA